MRWINNKSFVGIDRRKRRPTLRFGERRVEASATDAPTLASGLRQLRVLTEGAHTGRGVAEFVTRTRLIAELAHAYGEAALSHELSRLADLVAAEPHGDWRERLGNVLSAISERYSTVQKATTKQD